MNRDLMPRQRQSFEDAQEVSADFAKELKDYSELAFDYFARQVAWSMGLKFWDDLEPADKKHAYAQFPPVLLDGSVPPWQGVGPNWPAIQAEMPDRWEMHVEEYARLAQAEMKANGALANA